MAGFDDMTQFLTKDVNKDVTIPAAPPAALNARDHRMATAPRHPDRQLPGLTYHRGVDFRGQLASVWLRRRSILALALVAALAVLVVGALAPPVYATDATLRINSQGEAGAQRSEAVTFYAQTVVGLIGTAAVLDDAVVRSRLELDSDEAADRITVTQSEIPGFVSVRAIGPSPADSAALTNAVSQALAARIKGDESSAVASLTEPLRRQLETLEADLARLAPTAPNRQALEERYSALFQSVTEIESRPAPELILGPPASANPSPVSPTPVRDALLTFLVALIVVGEAVVVVRAMRGRLSEGDPAAQVEGAFRLPAVELNRTGDPVAALAPLYQTHLRKAPAVLVVQRGPAANDVGLILAETAALFGGSARHADLTLDPAPDPTATITSIRSRTLDSAVLASVINHAGAVVLAVDTADSGLRQISRDLEALRAVGSPAMAVLIWRGRFPRQRRSIGVGKLAPLFPTRPVERAEP